MASPISQVDSVAESTLRELCSSGVEVKPEVIAVRDGGFALVVAFGAAGREVRRVLGTSRGPLRRFGSIDTVGLFLRDLAIHQFVVDLSDFQPGRIRGPRPDRAEALRKTKIGPKQASLLLVGNQEGG